VAKKKTVKKRSAKKKATATRSRATSSGTGGASKKKSAKKTAKSAKAGSARFAAKAATKSTGTKKSTNKKQTSSAKAKADATAQATPATPPEPVAAKVARRHGRVVRPAQPNAMDQESQHETLSESKLKRCKSGLTRKEINQLRKVLLEKREEIVGDVLSMEKDARNNGTSGNLSHMPVHMADVGTDYYQQEFTLGLVESERKLLREIDGALDRIEKGYYGVCMETGKPIGKPRLEIKPWAKYCIEVVREREKRGLM